MNSLTQHHLASTSEEDTQPASTRWPWWPVRPGGVRVCLKNNVGENGYDFTKTIPTIASKFVEASGYVPKVPKNAQLEHIGDNVLLSWDKSDCAKEYKLTFKSMNGKDSHHRIVNENFANLEEPEACSDVYLSAGAYGRYSEEILIDNIKPSEINTGNLSLNVNTSTNSVEVKWDASLVCIDTFAVQVCKNEECKELVKVYRNKTLPGFEFTSTDLDPCSEYTISVKPLHKGKYLEGKVSTFKTLFPLLDDVDLSVTAVVVDEGLINISWSPAQCASSYQVFQIVSKMGANWEAIGETEKLSVKLEGDPCTEYRYGVKVTINGTQSDIYEADMPVIIPPGTIQPSLTITNITTTSVVLSVDHAYCITENNISFCKTNPHECLDHNSTTVKHSKSNIITQIENLSPCSPYSVHSLITTNDTKLDLVDYFQTLPTYPIAPENFTANFDPETHRITFSFASVSCATSYKLYKNVEGSEAKLLYKTKNTSSSFDFMDGCGIRFAASGLVNGTDGPKTEFVVTACGAQASSALFVLAAAVSLVIVLCLATLCINKHTNICKNNQENNNIRKDDIEERLPLDSVNDIELNITLMQEERTI